MQEDLYGEQDNGVHEVETSPRNNYRFNWRSEQFKCGKCNSNWGEVRATCFNCGHDSEDLST